MASVDKDTLNVVAKTTGILAAPSSSALFDGAYVFAADAFPALALVYAMKGQSIDGAYGRAFNAGRGVVGEGGDTGPGVVGIAGNVIARPDKFGPRELERGPQLAQGFRAGVVGFGADPTQRGESATGDAFGVFGFAERRPGVYGRSGTTGVIGDGNAGHVGVEGSGNSYGVYGHVNYSNPNADGVGVFGAAAITLGDPDNPVGRAGAFVGPVDVIGNLTVTGNLVVWGTGKAAAARHTDGTHRLLYCTESPESQFEDFGEAKLVKGRARVRLDRDFAAVADIRHYHVFLTPYGDSKGLYVSGRTGKAFRCASRDAARATLDSRTGLLQGGKTPLPNGSRR